jgi:hypothetical protein
MQVNPSYTELAEAGITYVKHLQDKRYTLVNDSQDIVATLEQIGRSDCLEDNFGCLLVEVLDGDYGQVWGIASNVPYLDAIANPALVPSSPATCAKLRAASIKTSAQRLECANCTYERRPVTG